MLWGLPDRYMPEATITQQIALAPGMSISALLFACPIWPVSGLWVLLSYQGISITKVFVHMHRLHAIRRQIPMKIIGTCNQHCYRDNRSEKCSADYCLRCKLIKILSLRYFSDASAKNTCAMGRIIKPIGNWRTRIHRAYNPIT